ncbi:MAG: radical SAM protein [Deltaproteobacteria bacterium]|nr:radical SAM protein [Deltaproteobacteria bacterium]
MANVLLFNPPAPGGGGFTREGRCTQEAGVWATQWPPLSLTTTAALLIANGHIVKVFDFPALGMTATAISTLIRKEHPDLAIWGTATPTLGSDLQIARLIKEISPSTITAVMGTHVTARPEDALSERAVDAVIRGEPEGIIGNLCRVGHSNWKSVNGISYRRKQLIQHNPDADFLAPPDIPAPAWHLIDHGSYRLPLKGRPFLMVAPVRGCPYRCTFCTAPLYYGAKLRRRPIENVLREIEINTKSYSISDIFIWADTFTADRDYVREFCRAVIARSLSISWTCNSRVDTIDEETLMLMKKAGLWMISYGLESGNDGILARSGKKMTVAQSRKAVLWAKQTGIRVAGHFIFGLPGEKKSTMEETLALALELPLDIAQFYAAAPFPGTGLYAEAKREGWLRKDSFSSQASAVMDLPGLSADEVDDFRRFAFRKFYGRPQAALNLLSMAEWEALKSVPAAMKRFLGWTR